MLFRRHVARQNPVAKQKDQDVHSQEFLTTEDGQLVGYPEPHQENLGLYKPAKVSLSEKTELFGKLPYNKSMLIKHLEQVSFLICPEVARAGPPNGNPAHLQVVDI